MKQRVLVKISGAAIKGKHNNIFDNVKLLSLCKQLINLNKKANVGVVIGGGNIWRGNMNKDKIFNQASAHYMGMVSTVINGIAFVETINKLKGKAVLYSALGVDKVTKKITTKAINEDFKHNKIIFFAGGTGKPFFTTDTGCALRAKDMRAKFILMAKDGVDGIYSADPKKSKKAKFFKNLTYKEAINKKLGVMDITAMSICQKNNISIRVFNVATKDSIVKAFNNKIKHTYIHK